MTGQRMAIFEAVFKESSHFTAEELLDKARLIDRTVSRATVYRTPTYTRREQSGTRGRYWYEPKVLHAQQGARSPEGPGYLQ